MIKLFTSEVLPHVAKATIIISGDKEKCVVAIICDPKEKGVKVKPITIKGSAEEVETSLETAIKEIFSANKEALSNYKDVAKDVKSATSKTTAKKDVKAAETDEEEEEPTKGEKVEPPKYSKEQNLLLKKGKEAVEKAGETSDLDMIDYFENQYVKKYTEAAIVQADIDDLKAKFAKIRESKGGAKPAAETKEKEEVDDGLFAKPADGKTTTETKTSTKTAETKPKEEKKEEKKAEKKEEKKDSGKPASTTAKEEDDSNMIF